MELRCAGAALHLKSTTGTMEGSSHLHNVQPEFILDVCSMVCQFLRPERVSSEQQEIAPDAGSEEQGGGIPGSGTATEAIGSYHPLPTPLAVLTRAANTARVLRFGTYGKSYPYNTLLQRPPKTTRPWRRHAWRSSRQRTPWGARDTSPGAGTWPPPINPTAESV